MQILVLAGYPLVCRTLARLAKEYGLTFRREVRAHSGAARAPSVPILELIAQGVPITQSRLRSRLIAEGVLEYRCSGPSCPIVDSWLGQPVTLQLDHINGDALDNRLESLRFLCPNCHSQTPTFGRGKGRPAMRRNAAA